jgi:hypothetical protein
MQEVRCSSHRATTEKPADSGLFLFNTNLVKNSLFGLSTPLRAAYPVHVGG